MPPARDSLASGTGNPTTTRQSHDGAVAKTGIAVVGETAKDPSCGEGGGGGGVHLPRCRPRPRILCLHGGGTNSLIFRAQCRVLRAHLEPHFRLVFAVGPFHSPPGPDVELVYSAWGPFRSWLPVAFGGDGGGAQHQVDDVDGFVAERIDESIAAALNEDERSEATTASGSGVAGGSGGAVVGLLGFSQGARVAASLLMRRQLRRQDEENQSKSGSGGNDRIGLCHNEASDQEYRFAVLMAGRGPLLGIGSEMKSCTEPRPLLQLPTIHVHGLRDAAIRMHRDLLNVYCNQDSARLVEWDGDHRVPIRTADVTAVVNEILQVASEQGLILDYM